jgi:hypothetical protein
VENGRFLAEDDSRCLLHTARLGLTLVTYDRRIIPPLLKIWAEAGREHGGAIFVDENAISSAHTGDGYEPCTAFAEPEGNGTGQTECAS